MHSVVLLAVGAFAMQGTARTQGPAVDPGSLQIAGTGVICPLKGTQVSANIEGFGARVVVVQTFTNPSPKAIEAVYTFPLPSDSAVDGMRMIIGNRVIDGVIKKRAEAKQTYEKAKKEGKSAALLDQERPNVFTQSVANIPPGADIRVAITYVQLLKFENDEFEFVFPMVVGPRYLNGSTPDPEKVSPPIVPPGTRSGSKIQLDVQLDAGAPITSLHSVLHKVETEKIGQTRAHVRLAKADEIPNRDFILRYGVASGSVVGSLLTHRDPKRGGFFTLILMPPKAPTASQVAPKEAIFVIDQSGSQNGFPIEKSKELTSKFIEALNPGDTFNVISFSGEANRLWPEARANTAANRQLALAFVKKLEANGGTQIHKGIIAALSPPADPERTRVVAFNTDGYVGNEAVALQEVQKHRGSSRIFTFGIGNSVNRYLIEAMSVEGRGDHEIITLNADADAALQRFIQRTDAPILTDIVVSFEGVGTRDLLPRFIPDVFSEKPVIIKGRYDKPGNGFVVVKGKLGGRPWSNRYPVRFPDTGNSGSAIGSLWAREKVKDLELQDQMQRWWSESAPKRDDKFYEDAITNLALDFGIMTKYTSFVAVDQRVTNSSGTSETIRVPVEMADGVTYEGIFGSMAQKDLRLAPAPATPAFQAGDPLLSVEAPANAREVVAVFPEGDVKPLAWNERTRRWEVRFDIPLSFRVGTYKVRVYVVGADGSRKAIEVPFEVSKDAPRLTPKMEALAPGLMRIEIDGDPRWARLTLLTPWNDRLEMSYDSKSGKIRLELKLPKDFKGGWFRLIGLDRAHNQAEVRLLLNAKGEIEKIEPAS
jgi:Ca-activated chloride channel family protein